MVSIARALMLNPALILMDEPSEGLAPLIVQEIVNIVTQLKNTGIGILLIEQNLKVALELSDMHYILDKGAVCFTGTSDMLRGNEKILGRSEERRVGKEWVSTCRSRWSPEHYKKTKLDIR